MWYIDIQYIHIYIYVCSRAVVEYDMDPHANCEISGLSRAEMESAIAEITKVGSWSPPEK